jgi:hypothetical protein
VPHIWDKESKVRGFQKAIHFVSLCLKETTDFDKKINDDLEI